MKYVLLVLTLTFLAACSTSPRRIACDRHLVPINPPAATSSQSGHAP